MKRYDQGSIGMRKDKDGAWCDYEEAKAEIERLRGENDELANTLAAWNRERTDEIERLRGLLGDVQIIMDSHNNIVGNLNGEITRLRGLLREGLDHHDEYNWQQRVREALGE